MTNPIGKRFVCAICKSEMLVTKGGDGTLQCCGKAMELKTAAAQQPEQKKPEEKKQP